MRQARERAERVPLVQDVLNKSGVIDSSFWYTLAGRAGPQRPERWRDAAAL